MFSILDVQAKPDHFTSCVLLHDINWSMGLFQLLVCIICFVLHALDVAREPDSEIITNP